MCELLDLNKQKNNKNISKYSPTSLLHTYSQFAKIKKNLGADLENKVTDFLDPK